jgi:hypothetical protein
MTERDPALFQIPFDYFIENRAPASASELAPELVSFG